MVMIFGILVVLGLLIAISGVAFDNGAAILVGVIVSVIFIAAGLFTHLNNFKETCIDHGGYMLGDHCIGMER